MVVVIDTDQSDDGQKHGQGARLDPKLGAPRKTAGVRNLPKIAGMASRVAGKGVNKRQQGKAAGAFGGKVDFEENEKV